MDKKQATEYLASRKASVLKNSEIAKKNILNNVEGIVRNFFGGEFTIPASVEELGENGYRLKSVTFVPEKQKDQVFHRLEYETVPNNPKEKPQAITEQQIGIETALAIFGEVFFAAEQAVEKSE